VVDQAEVPEPSQGSEPSASVPRRRARDSRRRERVEGGRIHRHNVRVTPEEEAELLMRAEAQRVSIPRLLVESALATGRPSGAATAGDASAGGASRSAVMTVTERRDLVAQLFIIERALGKVGANINQIAKVTNATGEWQPETRAAMDYLRRIVDRLDTTIDSLAL
jgi:hypothetical protein